MTHTSQAHVVTALPSEALKLLQITPDGSISYDIQNKCTTIVTRLQMLHQDLRTDPLDVGRVHKSCLDLEKLIGEGAKDYSAYVEKTLLPTVTAVVRQVTGNQDAIVSLEALIGRHNEGDIADLNRKFDALGQTIRRVGDKPIFDPDKIVAAVRDIYAFLDERLPQDANKFVPRLESLNLNFAALQSALQAYFIL